MNNHDSSNKNKDLSRKTLDQRKPFSAQLEVRAACGQQRLAIREYREVGTTPRMLVCGFLLRSLSWVAVTINKQHVRSKTLHAIREPSTYPLQGDATLDFNVDIGGLGFGARSPTFSFLAALP